MFQLRGWIPMPAPRSFREPQQTAFCHMQSAGGERMSQLTMFAPPALKRSLLPLKSSLQDTLARQMSSERFSVYLILLVCR